MVLLDRFTSLLAVVLVVTTSTTCNAFVVLPVREHCSLTRSTASTNALEAGMQVNHLLDATLIRQDYAFIRQSLHIGSILSTVGTAALAFVAFTLGSGMLVGASVFNKIDGDYPFLMEIYNDETLSDDEQTEKTIIAVEEFLQAERPEILAAHADEIAALTSSREELEFALITLLLVSGLKKGFSVW